jgi:hypothetical protein
MFHGSTSSEKITRKFGFASCDHAGDRPVTRVPRIEIIRRDHFEKAEKESVNYQMWIQDKQFMLAPSIALATLRMQSFKDFAPCNAPTSYSLDSVLKAMEDAVTPR